MIIKWLEKECTFQNFGQNKVHISIKTLIEIKCAFQQSESHTQKSTQVSHFSSSVPPQVPRGLGKAGIRGSITISHSKGSYDDGGRCINQGPDPPRLLAAHIKKLLHGYSKNPQWLASRTKTTR